MEDTGQQKQVKLEQNQVKQKQDNHDHFNSFQPLTFNRVEKFPSLARGREAEELYTVKIPTGAAPVGEAMKNPQSKLCNKKNKIRSKIIGTAQHRKVERAERVTEFQEKSESKKNAAVNAIGREVWDLIPEAEEEDIKNFYDLEKGQFDEIVHKFAGTYEEHEAAVKACIERFLELDIHNLDLNTDEAFVANLSLLEKIGCMTDGVTGLIDKNPDIVDKLEPDVRKKVKARLEFTQVLTEYYHLRMSVIADPLFKIQKNSDLVRFGTGSSEQERSLAVKLQRLGQFMAGGKLKNANDISFGKGVLASRLKTKEKPSTDIEAYFEQQGKTEEKVQYSDEFVQQSYKSLFGPCLRVYRDHIPLVEKVKAEEDKLHKHQSDPEKRFIKTEEEIKRKLSELKVLQIDIEQSEQYKLYCDLEKMGYVKQGEINEDVIGRDQQEGYCVAGQDKKTKVPRSQILLVCGKLMAGQKMDIQEKMNMFRNLLAAPELAAPNERYPLPMAEVYLLNRDGMRQTKQLFSHQMEYLCNKYGTWLEIATPQEITAHKEEIMRDFADIRAITDFVEYTKNFPGVYDKKSKQDQRMDDLLHYYLATFQSGYFKMCFKDSFRVSSLRSIDQMQTARRVTRNMPKTVNWELRHRHDYRSQKECDAQDAFNMKGFEIANNGFYMHLSKEKVSYIVQNSDIFANMLRLNYLRLSEMEAGDMGEPLMRDGGGNLFGWQNVFSENDLSLLILRLAGGLGDKGSEIGIFTMRRSDEKEETLCGIDVVNNYCLKKSKLRTAELQQAEKDDKGVAEAKADFESKQKEYDGAESDYTQFQQSDAGMLSLQLQEKGLQDLRKMICSKYRFMKRKYGAGLKNLSMRDLLKHWNEIYADFSNEQVDRSLIMKYTDLFNTEEKENKELWHAMFYYTGIFNVYKMKLMKFKDMEKTGISVDTRITVADLLSLDILDSSCEMESSQQEIKWGLQYEQDFEFTPMTDEEAPVYAQMREASQRVQPEGKN